MGFFNRILITFSFIFVLSGCQKQLQPEIPVDFSDSTILVTRTGNLSDEITGETVEIEAGDRVNLGLKLTYSDETQELIPVSNVSWSVAAPDNDISSFSIRSNSFRALKAGNYKLTAKIIGISDSKIPSEITKNLKIKPASPDAVIIVSGSNQTAIVTNELIEPLSVKVIDPFGNAVSNVKVSFSSLSGQVTETEVSSLEDGTAKTRYVLGTVAGEQIVKAEIGNFIKRSANILVNADPDAPYQLHVIPPQSVIIAGEQFLNPIKVLTEDKYGNKVKNDLRTIVLSGTKEERCIVSSSGQLISPALEATSIDGLAEFPGVSYTVAEPLYLKASSNEGDIKKGCASTAVDVFPANANGIIFRTQPLGSLAGKILETQPRVDLVDRFNNTISLGSGKVKLTVFSDQNCVQPSIGTLTSTPSDMVFGSAKFLDTTYSRTDQFYLKADFKYGVDRMVACSSGVKLNPNEPSQVGFVSYPNQITAGEDFEVELKTKDFLGNDSGKYDGKVSLIPYNDPLCRIRATGDFEIKNIPEGTLPSFLDGSTIISSNYNKSGVIFLKATTENFSVCSGSITVNPNTPNFISFINQPGSYSGIIGDFLSINPKVAVTDRFGNTVTSAAGSVSVAPYTTEGCTSSEGFEGRFISSPANIIGGVATFKNLSYDKTNLLYLKASYTYNGTLLEDCSNPLTYNIDPTGINLSFDSLSTTGVSGQIFKIQPRIRLSDRQGNDISDSVFGTSGARISLSAYTDPTCNDLSFAPGKIVASPALVSNSYAQFSDVYYTLSGKIYLRASLGSKSICSPLITIKASAISKVNIAEFSASELVAGELFEPFSINIKDKFGNVVEDTPGTITVKAYTNNTCSILTGLAFINESKPTVSGIAVFDELTYTRKQPIYLKASFLSDDGENFAQSGCSQPVVVKPNIPTQVIIKSPPSRLTVPNQLLQNQPVYLILDRFENQSIANSELSLDFYKDSDCLENWGVVPVNTGIINGESNPLSLSFFEPGEYFVKADVFNFGISKCFSASSEKITVAEPLTLAPERTRMVESSDLKINPHGGVRPFFCSAETVSPQTVSGYTSKIINDCEIYQSGQIINESEAPIKEKITVTDSFGQVASFDVSVYKPMTYSVLSPTIASLDFTRVSIFGSTIPEGFSSCEYSDSLSCNNTDGCFWRQDHSTIQVCRGKTTEFENECSLISNDSCVSNENCVFTYPTTDIITQRCAPSTTPVVCSSDSIIGTQGVSCDGIIKSDNFFILSGKNPGNTVITELVSVTNKDTGQNLNIPIDVRPIFSLDIENNPTKNVQDRRCSKAIISNKNENTLVPLNKTVNLPLKSIRSSTGISSGNYYSSSDCVAGTEISEIDFPQGQSQISVYYKPQATIFGEHILSFGSNLPVEQFKINVIPTDPLVVQESVKLSVTDNSYTIVPQKGVLPYSFSVFSGSVISSNIGQTSANFVFPKYVSTVIRVTDAIGDFKDVTVSVLPTDCTDLKFAKPTLADGLYEIKKTATSPVMQIFCDMSSFSGGWTLVMKSLNDNNDFIYSSNLWTNDQTLNETDFNFSGALNSKYATYSSTPFDQVMIVMNGRKRFFQFDRLLTSLKDVMINGGEYSIWPNVQSSKRLDLSTEESVYFWETPTTGICSGEQCYPHETFICRNFGINKNFHGADASKARLGFQYSQERFCGHPGTTEGLGLIAPARSGSPTSNSGVYIWEQATGRPAFKKATVFVRNSRLQKIGTTANPGVSCKRIREENPAGTYKTWRLNVGNDEYQLVDIDCSDPARSYALFGNTISKASAGTGWTKIGNISSYNDIWKEKSAIGYAIYNTGDLFHQGMNQDYRYSYSATERYNATERYSCGFLGLGTCTRTVSRTRTVTRYSYSSKQIALSDNFLPYSEVLLYDQGTAIDWAYDGSFRTSWFANPFDFGKHAFYFSDGAWYTSAGRNHGCGGGYTELPSSYFHKLDTNSIYTCKIGDTQSNNDCSAFFTLDMKKDNNWTSRFFGISDTEYLNGGCVDNNRAYYNFSVYVR